MKKSDHKELLRTLRCVSLEPSYWNLENDDLDVEGIVNLVAQANANALRVGFFEYTGYAFYPSSIAPQAPGLRGRDLLAEFQQACRNTGIELIVYLNCSWDYNLYQKDQGWLVRILDKPSVETAAPFARMCLNSPYRDYALSIHKEVMERYKPDIVYFDTFKLNHFCTCQYCRRELEAATGLSVPVKEDWKNNHWVRYLAWRLQREGEIANMFTENVKSINPEAVTIFNRERFQNQISSTPEANMQLASQYGDHIHGEAAIRMQKDEFWHINQQCFYGQAMGVDLWLWVEYVNGLWTYSTAPADELKLKIVKIIANGGRPNIWSIPCAPTGDLSTFPDLKQVYGLIKNNPDSFDYTSACVDTAILASTASRQFYVQGVEPYKYPYTPENNDKLFQEEFDGWSKLCLYTHQLQTYILDGDLTPEQLARYKVLILPNIGAMSDAGLEAIEEYVKRGGGLIASYETSLYDERGKKRSNYGLAKIFGCDYEKNIKDLGTFGQPFEVQGYFTLSSQEVIKSAADLIPAAGRAVATTPTTSKVLGHLVYPGSYHITFNEKASDIPAILCHEYGAGRVVYLPYEFGYSYCENEPLPVLQVFKDMIAWARKKTWLLETNAPALTDITLRKLRNGHYALHVIPTAANRPLPDHTFAELHDVKISLNLTALGLTKLSAKKITNHSKKIDHKTEDNKTTITFHTLNDYEVIELIP